MIRLTNNLVRRGYASSSPQLRSHFMCRLLFHSKPTLRTSESLEYDHTKPTYQVTIIGVNPVAQSLCLLLKDHPSVSRIVVYDQPNCYAYGVGLDLSHIPSRTIVEGRAGNIGIALFNTNIVCLVCGELRRPGQTDYDLFKSNADLLIHPVQEISRLCPNAFVLDLTEPINYTMPLISQVLESVNAFDKRKVLGVTGVDSMRAQARLHDLFELPEQYKDIHVPVICGHSASTAVPLVSHVRPWISIDSKAAAQVIEHVRESAHSVLQSGSHQTSHLTAFAGAQAVVTILNALNGCPDAHVGMVANDNYNTKYFAGPLKITKDGVYDTVTFKILSNIEEAYLHESIQELACDVHEAEAYYNELCNKLT